MPVHDWTRVDAGTFHHFHGSWITHLSEALNAGLLPPEYYALSEQHAGKVIADILTLHEGAPEALEAMGGSAATAVEAARRALGEKW